MIDAVLVEDDHPGSLLPFDPGKIRRVVLSRAEPTSVGMSPLGGLLEPCGRDDDFGVEVRCTAPGGEGRPLLAPISPGLYRTAHVAEARRIPLDVPVTVEGPGLLEFDGDRERVLGPGEKAEIRVVRDGPWVIGHRSRAGPGRRARPLPGPAALARRERHRGRRPRLLLGRRRPAAGYWSAAVSIP